MVRVTIRVKVRIRFVVRVSIRVRVSINFYGVRCKKPMRPVHLCIFSLRYFIIDVNRV